MSNIINVKEERNVLSYEGEVFDIVANSTNFYLKFSLDEDWNNCSIVTAIFNMDGERYFVDLDAERTCQIPATNASKILFCITAEPDNESKLSSTILSLNVEASGCTCKDGVAVYENAHRDLLGLIGNLQQGIGVNAEYAHFAGSSQTQVSLTGDETVSGEKNFVDRIKYNSLPVPNYQEVVNPNLLLNGSFRIYQRTGTKATRSGEDVFCADRWLLMNGDGEYVKSYKSLECLDSDGKPIVMCQWVEDLNGTGSAGNLFGKTLTFSATVDGVRYSGTTTIPEKPTEDYIYNIHVNENFALRIYVKYALKRTGVQLVVNPGVKVTVADFKLEESLYPTKYVERIFIEEFALCQRYFMKLRVLTIGRVMDGKTLRFFIPTPTKLRSNVNRVIQNHPYIIYNGAQLDTNYDVKVDTIQDNGILFKAVATTENFFVENGLYLLVNGSIFVDGELY